MTLPYQPIQRDGLWHALLTNGESIGCYLTLAELERDMQTLIEHVERGAHGGKAR